MLLAVSCIRVTQTDCSSYRYIRVVYVNCGPARFLPASPTATTAAAVAVVAECEDDA